MQYYLTYWCRVRQENSGCSLCTVFLCEMHLISVHFPVSTMQLQTSPSFEVWQWFANTPIDREWDDYSHDTRIPCMAETVYCNGFNLCWLTRVLASYANLAHDSPWLLQGEFTNGKSQRLRALTSSEVHFLELHICTNSITIAYSFKNPHFGKAPLKQTNKHKSKWMIFSCMSTSDIYISYYPVIQFSHACS